MVISQHNVIEMNWLVQLAVSYDQGTEYYSIKIKIYLEVNCSADS